MTKRRCAELARRFGLSVADQARQPGHQLRAHGRYTDVIERLKRTRWSGRHRRLRGRVIGRIRASSTYVGQRRGLGIAAHAPLYVVHLDADTRRVVVGPREALKRRPHRVARHQLESAAARGTRGRRWPGDLRQGASRPARRSGVAAPRADATRSSLPTARGASSPAQACVFYDAPAGQARVLGGGFIRSAVPRAACATPGLHEAMAG